MIKKLLNMMLVGVLALSMLGCSKEKQPEATYETYYELGVISTEQGDYEAAVAAFEQALELEITEDAVVELLRAYIGTGADSLSVMNKMKELGRTYSGKVPSFESLYERLHELINQHIRFADADVYIKETDVRYLGIPVNELTVRDVGESVPSEFLTSVGGAFEAVHIYGKNENGQDIHFVIADRHPDSPFFADTITLTPDCYQGLSVDGFGFGDSKRDVLKKIADVDYETILGIDYCTYCDEDATVTIWSGKGHYMGSLNEHVGYSEEEANAGSYFSVFLYSHNVSELELRSGRVKTPSNVCITFYFDDNDILVGYDDFSFNSEYGISVIGK